MISKTLSIDTDDNGSITADELKEAMRQQGLNPSNEDLKRKNELIIENFY